jgi:photosystem II stability/assembly factor-like uncharacterized protein
VKPSSRSSLFLFFSGLLWLVGRTDLEAVSGRWESVGPDSGALVQLLAVSPSATATVYAAVLQSLPDGLLAGSIARTDDSGQSWKMLATGLPQISSLAVDPGSLSIAYVGTAAGVFKTTSGGIRWEASSDGLDSLEVNSLAIDPLSPSILYAGTTAPTSPGSDKSAGGVYKSIDGGLTWRKSSTGLTENAFGFLSAGLVTVAPSSPATIYTVNTEGIYKSVDAGSNWSLVNRLSGDLVFSLAIDLNSPSTVCLGAQYAILKTTDGGATWIRIGQNSGLPFELIRSLTADPVSPLTIYAGTQNGLVKTTDGGTTWVPLANGPRRAVAFAIDPRSPSILYADGVLKSTDGGETWISAKKGLRKMGVSSVVVAPGLPTFVYAAGAREGGLGVFKSADRGVTWTQTGTGLPDATVYSLAGDPLSEGTLFAGTGGGLYKTTDGATTWVPLPTPPVIYGNPWVTSIAVDPQTSSTVYAATSPVYIGLGNFAGGGVLKTIDGGDSWTLLSNTLVGKYTGPIVIDPHESSTLYIASGPTLFKSTDGGASTVPLSFGIDLGSVAVTSVAIDDYAGTVYAGTSGAGIFKSTDGGSIWIRINRGLTELRVGAIAIDRSAPATLYVGTRAGVFRSEDSGATWQSFSTGLANSGIQSLAIAIGGPKTIYAGTYDDGVFRLDLSSSSSLPMRASPRVLTPRG